MPTPNTNDDDPAVLQLAAEFRALYLTGQHDPSLHYPVAELVREEMAERGWDLREFCRATEIPFWDVAEEIVQELGVTSPAGSFSARS